LDLVKLAWFKYPEENNMKDKELGLFTERDQLDPKEYHSSVIERFNRQAEWQKLVELALTKHESTKRESWTLTLKQAQAVQRGMSPRSAQLRIKK
jgi:cobyrinic acid a,c-diamide synthase